MRAPLLVLSMIAGCAVPMGAECATSDECVDDGICLKGVCSGYSCDDGCENGLTCQTALAVEACYLSCTEDAATRTDCRGAQTCASVPSGDDDGGETLRVCL